VGITAEKISMVFMTGMVEIIVIFNCYRVITALYCE